MARFRIEWSTGPVRTPMTYWVHPPTNGPGSPCEPPLPRKQSQGYPLVVVTCREHELRYASVEELEHAIAVLSRKNLPRPRALARGHTPDWNWGAANSHWLSRFPAELRASRVREGLVDDLKAAREALSKVLG